jgi:glutathione S-transferase
MSSDATVPPMATIQLMPEYGYVMLVASATIFLNIFQMIRIGILRSRYGIQHPDAWSETYKDFNCAQRVHQNTLEGIPFFLVTLLMAGISLPVYAAAFGGVWIFGRVIYSIGYWMAPKFRVPGFLLSQFFGLFPLVGLSIYAGCRLLGWC